MSDTTRAFRTGARHASGGYPCNPSSKWSDEVRAAYGAGYSSVPAVEARKPLTAKRAASLRARFRHHFTGLGAGGRD
jgi:hypothetical protein